VLETHSLQDGVERFTGRLYRAAIEWSSPLQNLGYRVVARCSWVRQFYRDVAPGSAEPWLMSRSGPDPT
jgi:hypothetical protein